MNSKLQITLAVCMFLLLGVSILAVQSTMKATRMGREAAAAQAAADALRRQLQEPEKNPPALSSGMDADVWRERVRRLQAQLDEKDRLIASLRKPAEAAPEPMGNVSTNPAAEGRRPWRDRGARLEEIKQTDPKRYEEIQARRQEARQMMQRSIAEQATYFLDRNKAAMDEPERAEYDRLLGLLDETWRLAEQMQSDVPGEDRHTLMRTLHDNMQELTPLMETERDRAFYQIGLDFGYTESEAQEFTDYLNGVIDVTSMSSLFQGMHSGRGGGGDGGGERFRGETGAAQP